MAISKRVCVVLVAILLVSQQFASAEELPTVERASFPKDFVFGTATAAYQVRVHTKIVWFLINPSVLVTKLDEHVKLFIDLDYLFLFAVWRCCNWRWKRPKHMGYLHSSTWSYSRKHNRRYCSWSVSPICCKKLLSIWSYEAWVFIFYFICFWFYLYLFVKYLE